MRFNPPPNWPPAPPGWTPPPDWRPDPSWGPPPPGWQLWVVDPARRSRTPLIAGGVAVALVVVVGLVLAVVLVSRSDDGGGGGGGGATTTPPSAPADSDEEQIDGQIAAFVNAWNNEDFDAISHVVCDELRDDPEFTETDFLDSRRDSGRLSLTATEYDITGDKAVVTIEQKGESSTNDFDFVREGGEWKWCEL